MANLMACPGPDQLQSIALGDLPEASAAMLIEHIESCATCAKRMSAIAAEDTLVEAVRAKDTRDDGKEQQAVSRLLQKVQALVPAAKRQGNATLDPTPPGMSDAGETAAFSFNEQAAREEKEDDGLAPPQAPDEIGRLGPYRILKVLGEGGMGKVFLAEDPNLQRSVALKVMKPALAKNTSARQRFLREARLAASIEHDNIVHIYQVGEDRGVPFLAMQLLKGASLEDLLRRSGRMKIKQVLRIGAQIADGLAAAHERGMIHRDIKPGNVWIEPTGGGRVKILDFGLARTSKGETGLTQSGTILGTPAYMPPEQARGDDVDHRCDLYSLGCVLYRMATGDLPLKGNDTMAMLMALATQEPTVPTKINPEIPQPLSDLIMKLLAKDPKQRVGSAKEVVKALKLLDQSLNSPVPGDTAVVSASALKPPIATPISKSNRPNPFAGMTNPNEKKEPAATAKPEPMAPAKKPTLRLWMAAPVIVLLVLVPLGWWLSGILLRLQTPNGTLVIEISDKDVEARFKNGKLLLMGPDDKIRYTLMPSERNKQLPTGPYTIRVEGADGLIVDTPKFELKKGVPITVRVTMEPKIVAKSKDVPGKEIPKTEVVKKDPPLPIVLGGDPDRRAAVWILSVSGGVGFFVDGKELGAASVAELPTKPFEIRSINLNRHPKVTDEGLTNLQGLQHLTRLQITNTQASDAALPYLKECKKLESLLLYATRVTDSGLINLYGLTELRFVTVKQTAVTEDGAKKLAAALPKCQIEWKGGLIQPTVKTGLAPFNNAPQNEFAAWVDEEPLAAEKRVGNLKRQ